MERTAHFARETEKNRRMTELSCHFHIKINKPQEEVFQAVCQASQMEKYFTTGGASGDLVTGQVVFWRFHDFPSEAGFPVRVIECVPNERFHLQWESGIDDGWNDVYITFEAAAKPEQTIVRITEGGWPWSEEGARRCMENAGGWANMATCLKVFVEHGIVLREEMF